MNLKIDGIMTSEHIDSSGELLIVENHDISDLVEGRGVLNFEHSNKAEDIVGAIIYAHKILIKEDCENERQRKYWDFCKKPFVYIIGELFEDEEHPGAVAVAAMVRYYHRKGEKMLIGFSVEGATLERDDYILKQSVGRRCAITLRSCNKMAIAGMLEDPKEKNIKKSIGNIHHLTESLEIDIDSAILDDASLPASEMLDLHKAIESLNKTLEAGQSNVAPSQLVGQAALTREYISGRQKNRVKAAVRDWDRKRPLKEVIKASLPEVADEYINHFTNLAEELSLKKGEPKLLRIGKEHSPNSMASESQKSLVDGMYFDPRQKLKQFLPGHNEYSSALHKLKNDAGQHVMVKNPDMAANSKLENAVAGSHYYQLANDVFGMGEHVPVTNYFSHPELKTGPANYTEKYHQAMEIIPKAKTPLVDDASWQKAKKKAGKDGSLHKLMIMDHILGNTDRHLGNLLVHPHGHIMSIDNDFAFSHGASTLPPDYMEGEHDAPLHPEAAAWVKGLDAKKLAGSMIDQGHEPKTIKTALSGLKYYQKLADRPMTVGQMHSHVGGHMVTVNNEATTPAPEKARGLK
jgi:phosphoinositide 3-/4-kinase-like protein